MNADPLLQEQERRIWKCVFTVGVLGTRFLEICSPYDLHTISEVHNIVDRHVRNSAPQNIATAVDIWLNGVHPNDQELAFLARCCQSLAEHLRSLFVRGFTDEEAYRMLDYLRRASLKIYLLRIVVRNGETITTIIGLLPDVLHTRGSLLIDKVRFTSNDCHSFGQILGNKELHFLRLRNCSFPCLDDVSTILGGCFVGKTDWSLCCCVLKDKTIPHSNGTQDDYSEFRRILTAFYQREWTTGHDWKLDNAVRKLRDYVAPLRDTGFSYRYLLIPCQHAGNGLSGNGTRQSRSLEEWVEVFSHRKVNNRVDVLFHILSSNPTACVEAASLRQRKQNDSLTLQCWARCVKAKEQIKTRQEEISRRQNETAALALQCFVRCYTAKNRTRIRQEEEAAATTIRKLLDILGAL